MRALASRDLLNGLPGTRQLQPRRIEDVPLTRAGAKRETVFGKLVDFGRDLRGTLEGVAKAVSGHERQLLSEPLPPETALKVCGPLIFTMERR